MMVSDILGLPVPGPRILPFWATVPSATHTLPGTTVKRGRQSHSPERGMCHVRGSSGKLFGSGIRTMLSPVPCDLDHLILYVFCEALLKGLGDHGDLVPGQRGNR